MDFFTCSICFSVIFMLMNFGVFMFLMLVNLYEVSFMCATKYESWIK
jgi:hypothetical protein